MQKYKFLLNLFCSLEMSSNSAQLDMALWMLSDLSNRFFLEKLQGEVRTQANDIISDPGNTFSVCEIILAATELYLENDEITNWFYNSVREWIDDVNELWLSDPDYFWAKVRKRSRRARKSQMSFIIGKPNETIGDIPTTMTQFDEAIFAKQIRFYRTP